MRASARRWRLWLNAYRLCALVAEVLRGWRALFVHLSLWHEVLGAGEGSISQSAGQPGELTVEQLAVSGGIPAQNLIQILSQQAFQSRSEFSQQQMWYSGTVSNQQIVTTSQTENAINDVRLLIFRINMASLYLSASSVKRDWCGFSLAVHGRVWAVWRKRQLPRHDHTRLPGCQTSQCFGQ